MVGILGIGIALALGAGAAPAAASLADDVGERAEATAFDAPFMIVRVARAFASRRIVEVTEVAQRALGQALAAADALEAADARGRSPRVRLATVVVQGAGDRRMVEAVLRRQGASADVSRCVAALRPDLRPSTLELRWFDGGSGIPTGVAVVGPQADRLSRCVRGAVAGWRLPKPRCTAVIRVHFAIDAT